MIIAERVRLRAIERDDLPRFVRWLNDPEVRAGLVLFLPLSLEEEEQWYNGVLQRPVAERPLAIEIRQGAGWIHVGNCGFLNLDWRCHAGEVGIFIGEKQFWNQGYGTDVMKLLIKHGFETLNLNRISLDVYDNNPHAIRTYEKTGFVLEGRKRQAMYKNGKYIDILVMSVLRSEWQNTRSDS